MVDDSAPFGVRLRQLRSRAGMTRPVLGGLVGRSGEWVKAVETGRQMTPRLPLLLRLADALGVTDLVELTGDERLSMASFGKTAHEALPAIAETLAAYPLKASAEPVDVTGLTARVAQTWRLWHSARRHRTAVATLLPALLTDARVAVRSTEGEDRRRVLRSLAQTYHLTQLFLSFQPAPELVTLTGDRAMTAAQDADDPHAMAAAAWYVNHVYRDNGQQHEARVQLAMDAASLVAPERSDEDRALWGLLHLAAALSHAKTGHDGDAWRCWDQAERAADALPNGYTHPWLLFGRGMVDAYTVTMLVDLMRGGEAVRQAEQLNLSGLPSNTRRSFHTIEMARAYHQHREPVAVVHLLRRAYGTSPDTARFNIFTRAAVADLREHGGTVVRDEAHALAGDLALVG
ncbi:MAG: helix-turn-helix domain-containing protein [Sciscionella sp.]